MFKLGHHKLIFSNPRTSTRNRTLNLPVSDRQVFHDISGEMMRRFLGEITMNFRRVGVMVGNLNERGE
ncbi:hypothetical protein [Methanomethylovorans sp.]|uniref:DinB/UmuC family translesion DNA polymerase n=1 Tax=Methanomethylovorans sp. TaxID=2758717 RepID=UPI00351C03C6